MATELTPDQIRDDTRRDEDFRMQCINIVNSRMKPDDNADDLASKAKRLFDFIKQDVA